MGHATTHMALALLIALGGCHGEQDLSRFGAETLAAAGTAGGSTFATGEGVTLRRVSTSNDYAGFDASDLSPDGRYVSLIDWRTYNVAVRDLRTGALHRLMWVMEGLGGRTAASEDGGDSR